MPHEGETRPVHDRGSGREAGVRRADTGQQLLRLLSCLAGFGIDACAPTLLISEQT